MDHSLFNLCIQFKTHVCTELRRMPEVSREMLKGDYLFVIDGSPLFILLVDNSGAWSVLMKPDSELEVDPDCPFPVDKTQITNIIENSARCQIKTDGNTLKRLLLGTLRARVAFITQRVKISGDFPAFLKIISYLKTKGIKPHTTPDVLNENSL